MKGHHELRAIRPPAPLGYAPAPAILPWLGLLILPAAAGWMARGAPAWVLMWTLAATEWLALKLLTLRGATAGVPLCRKLGYLTLWPGLDACAFLAAKVNVTETRPPVFRELVGAWLNVVLGCLLAVAAVVGTGRWPPLLVGWIGMVALVFLLHFGALHLVSCGWRALGVNAPPIMRNPLHATSLTDFWSERWNTAFANCARRFVFRPVARRLGLAAGGAAVFLLSGLIHETVISLPARGGWGGPTLYFALQGVGVALERLDPLRSWLGRKHRGWLWTFAFTALPLPLLFHREFAVRVIAPLFGFRGLLP